MKFTSKDNLNSFTTKLKAWIKARKIKASDLDSGSATAGQVPTADGQGGVSYQTPQSGGITQAQADARYLQLSGGNLTGNINFSSTQKGLSVNNKQILNAGNGSNQPPQLGNIDVSGNLILATDDNGAIIHKISSANRVVLDAGNTSANPTLAGTEAALESLKLNGVNYKNQPSSMQILTTAPSADNTSGIKIVVLSSEPATKYNGFLYLIL